MKNNWNIDLEALAGVNRNNHHWIRDEFYLSPDNKFLSIVYSIAEYRMGWYFGSLAIYTNQYEPEEVLNNGDILCNGTTNHLFYSNDSRFAFVKVKIDVNHDFKIILPFLIIDLADNKFSYYLISNNFAYSIKDIGGCKFQLIESSNEKRFLSRNNEIIDVTKLSWYPMDRLSSLVKIVESNISNSDFNFDLKNRMSSYNRLFLQLRLTIEKVSSEYKERSTSFGIRRNLK